MGELVIVTGPPGAGKSSVSPLVADGFGSSVLIPGDWFFGLWRGGSIAPWLPRAAPQTSVAASAAAATVGVFSRADCQVVYDGFIPPAHLPSFAALAGLRALHYAVLLPAVTTCVSRVTARVGHGFTSADATRAMYREFTGPHLDARHLIPGEGASPAQVAKRILDRLADGALLWQAPHQDSGQAG